MLVPATSYAEVVTLARQSDKSGNSTFDAATFSFKIDLGRHTIAYLNQDGADVWVVPAEITEGSIRWAGYMPDVPPEYRGSRTPIQDLSNGRYRNPERGLEGNINRTSGRINVALVLWVRGDGRYSVEMVNAGSCHVGRPIF